MEQNHTKSPLQTSTNSGDFHCDLERISVSGRQPWGYPLAPMDSQRLLWASPWKRLLPLRAFETGHFPANVVTCCDMLSVTSIPDN